MTRQQANFKLLEILRVYFTQFPDIRFGQGLSNLGIATHKYQVLPEYDDINKGYRYVDIFFEEPTDILARFKFTTKSDELSHTEELHRGESGEADNVLPTGGSEDLAS